MTATQDPISDVEPGPEASEPTTRVSWRDRINAEAAIVLFAIPVIVVVGFSAFAIWNATATKDVVVESALAWPTIWQQIWEHVKLTFVSAFFVVVIAIPLGILLTRGGAKRFSAPVVGFANAGQAAPSVGLIVLFAMWMGFGFRDAIDPRPSSALALLALRSSRHVAHFGLCRERCGSPQAPHPARAGPQHPCCELALNCLSISLLAHG